MIKKFLVLLIVLMAFSTVNAASFAFESASNNYVINSDGSISVTENMTISFYEPLFEGYREIPLEGIQISDIAVYLGSEKLNHRVKNISNGIEISWDLSGSSKQNFRIEYTLKNALNVYDDVAEFNAKVWGDQWTVSLNNLSGKIALPNNVANEKDIYTFGHPQMEGTIRLQNYKDVVYSLNNIPAEQWVEVRVVFPRELLISTSGAKVIAGNGLQKILDEENQLGMFGTIALVLYFVLHPVVLAIVFFVILWFLYGREPKVDYAGIYERDLPYNYAPSVVGTLINQHTQEPEQKDFVADLMNICLKGIFKLKQIQGNKEDFEIMFIREMKDNELSAPEKEVYYFVKNQMHGKNVTFSELKKYVEKNPKKGFDFISKWSKAAEQEADKEKFFSKNIGVSVYAGFIAALVLSVIFQAFLSEFGIWIVIFFGSVLFGIFKKMKIDWSMAVPALAITLGLLLVKGFIFTLANFENWGWLDAILGIVVAFVLLAIFKQALPARTEKGALHYEKWMKFKDFLKDFSEMQTVSPDAIIMWEHFLVYAIPLGVAKEVEKAMKVVFANYEVNDSHIFYGPIYYSAFAFRPLNNFSSGIVTAATAGMKTSGSGGFRGGGFGGGFGGDGGFGGGGGGFR